MTLAPLHGLVLAGGQSRRMGRNKAEIAWGEGTLLTRALSVLSDVVFEVAVSTAPGRTPAGLPDGVELIVDDQPGLGPMGGLNSAFSHSPGVAWLVLAVDLPAVDAPLLRRLAAGRRAGVDAVVGVSPRGLEPLCAVYEPGCRPSLELAISAGQYALHRWLAGLRTLEVPVANSELVNLNRPEDWAKLESESRDVEQG